MNRTDRTVGAIILAAGESRRMGRAKALLPYRGGTFISVLAETLACCCGPVFAVFGFDAKDLMKNAPPSVVAVENPDYRLGMLTSLQAGLRAMGELPEQILFTLVDHPAIETPTVLALLHAAGSAAADPGIALVMPRYAGKRGHPVIIGRDIAREIMVEPPASKLNQVLDRHTAGIHYVDVDDAGVRDDIDDPRLYQDLLAREGARA